MQDIWPTGETKNQFILYIGGLFGLLYLIALFVGFAQRRCRPVVVGLSNPNESERVYEYILTVKTSLLPYSGCCPTTSVFIQLHGEFENTSFFLLKKYSVTQDILTRGALDIFVLHTTDYLGDINSVGVKLVDEICNKFVWRPTELKLYYPSQQTCWTSTGIPKLICMGELETHVLLSKRTNLKRKWHKEFLSHLLSHHQWLSMTMGGTRFGIFTSFLNRQLFFCCLALLLATNLICLVIVEDSDIEFDITIEKFIGCVVVTFIVSCVSWIVETLARNAKPSSKITRSFRFNGVHELKKQNLLKDVKETNELQTKNFIQDMNNHAVLIGKDIGTAYKSMKYEPYKFRCETDKSNNAKTGKDENNHSKQNVFSCCTQKQEDISQNKYKEHIVNPAKCEGLKANFSNPRCDDLSTSFSDPLELAEFHGVSFMISMRTFTSKTFDNENMEEYLKVLRHSVSRDLLRMLTEHELLLYFKLVVSGAPTDWFREFDYRAMCDEEILSFKPPSTFYKHPLEETGFPKEIADNLEVVNLNEEIHHVKEKSRMSDVDVMGSNWTYAPLYLFCQKDYMLFEHCTCLSEHCRKCTHLLSKLKGLSFLILKNSLMMIMDTSIKTSFSQPDSILKMLTDMLYLFVNSGMALIMEENVRMEVDENTLILNSAAAVIVHQVLHNLYKEQCEKEEMAKIQSLSKLFVTDLVQTAVKELRVEYSLQKKIRNLCEHVIQTATDEVWSEFHDPVHIFGEQMLKEALVHEISELCNDDETDESKDRDQIHERLNQAVLPWEQKMNDLSLSAKALLIQCLIERFETTVFKISVLYKHITECHFVERQVGEICTKASDNFIHPLLHQIQSGFSEYESIKSLNDHMEIYLGHNLGEFVGQVKTETHTVLYEQFLELMSRYIVKMALIKAKLKWTEELELEQDNQEYTEAPLMQEEITELRKELLPVTRYLKLSSRAHKEMTENELSGHIKRLSKTQKEYVSINLQNTVDLYSAVDDVPRDYTDEELYMVEWFVTGNLYKALPAGVKPALNFFMFSATLLAMAYFVLKGAEISTAQTQEWVCLVLISCALYGFVLEPMKVFIMMLMENIW